MILNSEQCLNTHIYRSKRERGNKEWNKETEVRDRHKNRKVVVNSKIAF